MTGGRTTHVRLACVAGVVVALLAFASPSGGTKPVGAARYLGEGKFGEAGPLAALQVARDRRRFSAAGGVSFVECASGFEMTRFRLRRPRRVRIGRAGRFAFSLQAHGRKLAVRGRFVTRDTVLVAARTVPGGGCRARLTLHRRFDPPFSGCRSQRAKTLRESDTGRIFEQRQIGARFYDPYFFTPVAYGCLVGVEKRVLLGENGTGVDGHGEELDHFRLAGPYAAFSSRVCPIDLCGWAVKSVDLRDGTMLRDVPSAGRGAPGAGPVTDLVLMDTGSIAWITSVISPERTVELWASDAAGERLVDSGPELVVDSLELNGSTLSWLDGSTARSGILD